MAEDTKADGGTDSNLDGLVNEAEPETSGSTEAGNQPEKTEEAKSEQVTQEAAKPAEETKPESHSFDKGLQQLQQRQAATDRKIEALLARIESQGGVATPSQRQQVAALQQQADELESITKSDPNEVDPYKAVTILAKRIKDLEAKQDDTNRTEKVRIESVQQSIARLQEERDRAEFARNNSDIADQYDNLLKSTLEKLDSLGETNPEARRVHAHYLWNTAVAEAKAKAKPAASLKTTPDKSVAGTKIATTTASAASRSTPKRNTQDYIDDLVAGA